MAYLAFELSRVKYEDVAMMGSRSGGSEWESYFPSGEHGTGSPSSVERVVLVAIRTLRLGSIDSAEPGDGSFL